MKYYFKYVKEGNKMTDAMKELYDIFYTTYLKKNLKTSG